MNDIEDIVIPDLKLPETLIDNKDPILHSPVELFDMNNPPHDPIELSTHLSECLLTLGGIGLSANQLGLQYRVFVIKSNPILACFNPRVVAQSDDSSVMDEGCLSYRGLGLKIKRPNSIRVRYAQPNGEIITRDFDGMTARIFQHELDHLNGITFLDRATRYHKEQGLRKYKSWCRQNRRLN